MFLIPGMAWNGADGRPGSASGGQSPGGLSGISAGTSTAAGDGHTS